ncbi:hypothetical protein A3A75_03180 [Candidatus Woesebacteria bacterium RIFCSPLOWO2_01_FULL_39_10]|uniref:Sulfotransferase domain-containing protein n=1 Tax=Candidatus Woesebacteria bacterium RIFCSPLOWO2_01_FULL_39_10 TaxID=1802516 RepID=A0A1F8B5A8_9BACT|nr:MAG: hypothetical protein A3A75_03180 [Candidatus Woesebacteria bacterium RIFCSPLOWO2_01_FULL_39_10]
MKRKNFNLDFVGIGAEKAGTTWLAECLNDHPEIYVPNQKEIFFFNEYDPHYLKVKNYRYSKGLSWYKHQFDGSGNVLKGEFSPTYLYDEKAAKRIAKDFPDTKIIVIFREPVSRAFSQFIHDKRIGLIKDVSFEEAISQQDNYIKKGYYFTHLKRYYKLFKPENILTLIYEDIKKNPLAIVRKTYKFLGVKKINFRPKHLYMRSNTAGEARLPLFNYFMMQTDYFLRKKRLDFLLKAFDTLGVRRFAMYIRDLNTLKLKKYPEVGGDVKQQLRKKYVSDIHKLEKLLKRNLSFWYK